MTLKLMADVDANHNHNVDETDDCNHDHEKSDHDNDQEEASRQLRNLQGIRAQNLQLEAAAAAEAGMIVFCSGMDGEAMVMMMMVLVTMGVLNYGIRNWLGTIVTQFGEEINGDDNVTDDNDAPVRYRRVPTEAPELADDGKKMEELLDPNQLQDTETR